MKEVKAPAVCGECKYWTEDPENPNHALYCSEYEKLHIEKTKKDKKLFAQRIEDAFAKKAKDLESIEENHPVAGYTLGVLKAIGIIIIFVIGWMIFTGVIDFLGCGVFYNCL